MSIGEEGDTRQYRRLRHSDYYVSKVNFEAEKSELKDIIRHEKCLGCGQLITGHSWDGYCLRCHYG